MSLFQIQSGTHYLREHAVDNGNDGIDFRKVLLYEPCFHEVRLLRMLQLFQPPLVVALDLNGMRHK